MRILFAALAIAGAFIDAAQAQPAMRQAQMSRDVTDAVRKQRAQQKPQAVRPQRARRCSCDK